MVELKGKEIRKRERGVGEVITDTEEHSREPGARSEENTGHRGPGKPTVDDQCRSPTLRDHNRDVHH